MRIVDIIRKNPLYLEIPIYFFVLFVSYLIVQKQILNGPDYMVHLNIINPLIKGGFYIPHPGFHLLIYTSSVITGLSFISITPLIMSIVITTTVIITKWIITELSGIRERNIEILLFSIITNIVIALYLPSFSTYKYVGQWSPNIWHSPTITLLKPFALLGYIFVWKFTENWQIKHGILASILLLIGTIVKPSFIICLIPALIIYAFLLKFNITNLIKIALILLPCILMLGFQFLETYLM